MTDRARQIRARLCHAGVPQPIAHRVQGRSAIKPARARLAPQIMEVEICNPSPPARRSPRGLNRADALSNLITEDMRRSPLIVAVRIEAAHLKDGPEAHGHGNAPPGSGLRGARPKKDLARVLKPSGAFLRAPQLDDRLGAPLERRSLDVAGPNRPVKDCPKVAQRPIDGDRPADASCPRPFRSIACGACWSVRYCSRAVELTSTTRHCPNGRTSPVGSRSATLARLSIWH